MTNLIVQQLLNESETLGESEPYAKGVIHGHWGCGKTTFAADAPDPFWVDFERSSDTLLKIPGKENIRIFRPKSVKQMKDIAENATSFGRTIVIDTVTTFQIFYMREYMREEASRTNGRRDRFEVYQGDYKYATAELTDFFLALQEAKIHVLFLAHSKEVYSKPPDQNTNATLISIRPAITPAVWDNLAAFVNVVGYLERKGGNAIKKEVERRLYLNETGVIAAKNRLGIQEDYISSPTFEGVFGNAVKL